jgi:hypothetical protein
MELLSLFPLHDMTPKELVKFAQSEFPAMVLRPQVERDRLAHQALQACETQAFRALAAGDEATMLGYSRAASMISSCIDKYLYGEVIPQPEEEI